LKDAQIEIGRAMATTSDIDALTARLDLLETQNTQREAELNTFYLMWAGALIFLMQSGFAVLSAGSIRAKNVKNILLKNLLDACVGALIWYFIGYGFAYDADACPDEAACAVEGAHSANAFIGTGPTNFALSGIRDEGDGHAHGYDWISFFFQYAFAAAAATIVSGAVAERCQLIAYLIYTSIITGLIYPVVVHWVWDGHGFLSAANPNAMLTGVIDFAGSGVVHMTGGWAALMGAWVLGPRLGRFGGNPNPNAFDGHSSVLQVLGTFILWFGWYGFNPGSTLVVHGASRDMARVAVTTTLAAATAAVTGLFLKHSLPGKLGGNGTFDLGHTCNSLLGGLVSITAPCSVVRAWGAILVGFFGVFVYHGASCAMRKAKIDDPLDAFAVHGACGAWGMLAVGIFAAKEYSYAPAEGSPQRLGDDGSDLGADAGLFMEGTRGVLFGTQLSACFIMISWVCTLSGAMFFALNKLGLLRVTREVEEAGADVSKHGGAAYPEQMLPAANVGSGAAYKMEPIGSSSTSN